MAIAATVLYEPVRLLHFSITGIPRDTKHSVVIGTRGDPSNVSLSPATVTLTIDHVTSTAAIQGHCRCARFQAGPCCTAEDPTVQVSILLHQVPWFMHARRPNELRSRVLEMEGGGLAPLRASSRLEPTSKQVRGQRRARRMADGQKLKHHAARRARRMRA